MVTFQRDFNSIWSRPERFYNTLIYFAHTNAMKSFSNETTFYKVVKKTFQTFYHFTDKPIVVMATFRVVLI